MKLTDLKTGKEYKDGAKSTTMSKLKTMSQEDALKAIKKEEKEKEKTVKMKMFYKDNEKMKPKYASGVKSARMNSKGEYEEDSKPSKGEDRDKYNMRKKAQEAGETTYTYKGKTEASGIKMNDPLNTLEPKGVSMNKLKPIDSKINVKENFRKDQNMSFKRSSPTSKLTPYYSDKETKTLVSRTVNGRVVSTGSKIKVSNKKK